MTPTLPHLRMFRGFDGVTNPALIAALKSLPGYQGTDTVGGHLDDAKAAAAADLNEATRKRTALVEEVTQALLAGRAAPKLGAQLVAKADEAVAQASGYVRLLQEVEANLGASQDETLRGAPAALTGHLDGQLQKALRTARALDLGRVTNAQEAIDADRVAAWQTYLALSQTYLDIRAGQAHINAYLTSDHLMAQQLHTFAAVRNYPAVYPRWYDRQRGVTTGSLNGEPVYLSLPWDEDDRLSLWRYAIEHHEVELWVPNPQQLSTAYAEAIAQARQLENLRERAERGAALTPDEQERANLHRRLEMGGVR